jgi:hypothetical protein
LVAAFFFAPLSALSAAEHCAMICAGKRTTEQAPPPPVAKQNNKTTYPS